MGANLTLDNRIPLGACTLGYRETIYPNGLEVLSDFIPPEVSRSRSRATLFVWVGSYYDPTNRYGLAHFVEHMSREKTTANLKRRDIFRLARSKDIYFNAETDNVETKYTLVCPDVSLFEGLDLMLEMAVNSAVKEHELRPEKGTITDEIHRDKANGDLFPDLVAKGLAFGVEPFSLHGLGSVEGVSSITVDDVVNFREKYYIPANMTLLVEGNQNYDMGLSVSTRADRFHGEVLELVDKYMGHLMSKAVELKPRTHQLNLTKPETHHIPVEEFDCVFLFQGTQNGDFPNLKFDLATEILKLHLNDQFNDRAREIRGLSYAPDVTYSPPPENFFASSVSATPEDIREAQSLIMRLQLDACSRVSDRSFAVARDQLYHQTFAKYRGGTSRVAEILGRRRGSLETYTGAMKAFDDISPKDVVIAANHIFSKPYVAVTMGPRS